MKKVDISESNEIGEIYDDKDKGYSKIPIEQINLNTEPIEIINDFTQSFFDTNIKSYIKVFLGFVIFVIILLLISILSGHFHYEKPDINENNNNNNNKNKADDNNQINNNENNNNKILLNLRRLEYKENINVDYYLEKYNIKDKYKSDK